MGNLKTVNKTVNLKVVILSYLSNKREKSNGNLSNTSRYDRVEKFIESEIFTEILKELEENINSQLLQTTGKVEAHNPVNDLQFSQDCVRETIEKIAELEQEIYNDIFDGINGFRTLDIDWLNGLNTEELKKELLKRVNDELFPLIKRVLVKWKEQEKKLEILSQISEQDKQETGQGLGMTGTGFLSSRSPLLTPSSARSLSPTGVHSMRKAQSIETLQSRLLGGSLSGSPQLFSPSPFSPHLSEEEREEEEREEKKKPGVREISNRRLEEAKKDIQRLQEEIAKNEQTIDILRNQTRRHNQLYSKLEKNNSSLEESLNVLTAQDNEKENKINSLNAEIVQKNRELREKRQEIERLSVQILGLEANAIADKHNLDIQVGAAKKKYQKLLEDFDKLRRETAETIRELEWEVSDLKGTLEMSENFNKELTEIWNVVETKARIEELEEKIENLQDELEFYREGNAYQNPQYEAENNFCQELARQENLEQAKEYLRELIPDLNQAEQNSITTIASVEELIRAARTLFEIHRLLGNPLKLPDFKRTNSEPVPSRRQKSASLFSFGNFSYLSPASSRRSSVIGPKEEEEADKDVKIQKLEMEERSLKQKIINLEGVINEKEQEISELLLKVAEYEGREEENFSPNPTDQQEEKTPLQIHQEQLISFLFNHKFSVSIFTVSFLIIGGLVWKIKKLQKVAKKNPLVTSSKVSMIIN